MNKNFKKKNKINNLLNRKLSFLINKNRYRRRSKLNAVPYIIKSNPQKYGPGRNICVVNGIYDLDTSTVYRVALQSMLLSNPEFSTRKLYFRYFKVLEIRTVFPPSGKNTDSIHYLNFSWNSIEESTQDIIRDDCTKMVPFYRPRTRIVKWRPIRSVINVNSISQEVPINFINMTEFISTDRVVSLPGWLYVSNTTEHDHFMIEVVVEFRGNDCGDVPKVSKIKEMKLLIEKWEKEIEKRKEKNNKNKIIDLLPAMNYSDEENEEIKEENEEEFKEIYEDIKEEKEEESKELNEDEKINEENIFDLKKMHESKREIKGKIGESILTNSRVKDINSSKPLINKKVIHSKNLKEDERFQDIEDPIFPSKFYEFKTQESWTGKEGTFNKLKNVIPTFIETEIKEESKEKSKLRKENVSKSKKHLLGETSLENIPSSKISEIT